MLRPKAPWHAALAENCSFMGMGPARGQHSASCPGHSRVPGGSPLSPERGHTGGRVLAPSRGWLHPSSLTHPTKAPTARASLHAPGHQPQPSTPLQGLLCF